jgi:ATP-dependent helicase HrpA
MAMNYKLLGSTDELRGQLVAVAAERAFTPDANVRQQADYQQRGGTAWQRLSEQHARISEYADQALLAYYALAKELSKPVAPLLEPSVRDMREQLARLMPKNFVAATPAAWLGHLPRFIKGISVRLNKLMNAGLARDQQGLGQVQPLERAYRERVEKHRREGVVDEAMVQYRWMLEEFRISVFAQELKTSVPVSGKRLGELWAGVRP